MKAWKLVGSSVNPTTIRILYVLLAILALALAGGAPDAFGVASRRLRAANS